MASQRVSCIATITARLSPRKTSPNNVIERTQKIIMTIHQKLINAAAAGETETARELLDRGADPNAESDMALYLAVRNGHAKTVVRLLDLGANINPDDDDGTHEIVAMILDRGNYRKAAPELALIALAAIGSIDEIEVLLDRGVEIHAEIDGGLRAAATRDQTNTVKYLLQSGAEIHVRNDAAIWNAAFFSCESMIELPFRTETPRLDPEKPAKGEAHSHKADPSVGYGPMAE